MIDSNVMNGISNVLLVIWIIIPCRFTLDIGLRKILLVTTQCA